MNGRMKLGMVLGVVALAAAVRAATPDEQGFIRDWIVSGPWPSYQVKDRGQGLETDFLNLEDEAAPHPGKRETAEFVADWGILMAGIGSTNEWGFKTNTVFDATWRPLHAESGIIRLNGRFAPIDDYFVTYAVCYIDAPETRAARLAVGSDDDHKVWLDLDLVGKTTTSQDIIPGSFRYDVTLPKGRSRLLFKLQDRTGGCGFCVQLTDREGKPMRDVSIALDPRGTATTLAARLAERRSPERLKARLAAAKETSEKARAALAEERTKEAALSNVCEKAAQDLREAYAAREAKYAAQHAGGGRRAGTAERLRAVRAVCAAQRALPQRRLGGLRRRRGHVGTRPRPEPPTPGLLLHVAVSREGRGQASARLREGHQPRQLRAQGPLPHLVRLGRDE